MGKACAVLDWMFSVRALIGCPGSFHVVILKQWTIDHHQWFSDPANRIDLSKFRSNKKILIPAQFCSQSNFHWTWRLRSDIYDLEYSCVVLNSWFIDPCTLCVCVRRARWVSNALEKTTSIDIYAKDFYCLIADVRNNSFFLSRRVSFRCPIKTLLS